MSTISWIMPAIWIVGFVTGYGLRSYISFLRRALARRLRYEVPPARRTLAPVEETEAAKLPSGESSRLVPEDVA